MPENMESQMPENDNEIVAEILRLGSQKKAAYVRLDGLEIQLRAGRTLITILRALFSKAKREELNAKHEELDETIRTIHALRGRMDKLQALLASRSDEVAHLWNYENTTSLSIQRESKVRRMQVRK